MQHRPLNLAVPGHFATVSHNMLYSNSQST